MGLRFEIVGLFRFVSNGAESHAAKGLPMNNTKKDQIRFGPSVSPGVLEATIRRQDGEIEIGTVREVQEGQPVQEGHEYLQMEVGDTPDGWHSFDTLYKSGPAQVATPAYRAGYDRIFGKREVGVA